MSEKTMVASSSSWSDSAEGEASTRSATSGGRKDASARANSARSFIRWNRSPSPVWVARSVMSFWLAGLSGSTGETVTVSAPNSSLSCSTGNGRLLGLRHRQGLVHAAALERDRLGQLPTLGPADLGLQDIAEPQPHAGLHRAGRLHHQAGQPLQ